MHFLKKLIESPILKDPAIKHRSIHRHFYRYSKGKFLGPALKLIKTNTRILVINRLMIIMLEFFLYMGETYNLLALQVFY